MMLPRIRLPVVLALALGCAYAYAQDEAVLGKLDGTKISPTEVRETLDLQGPEIKKHLASSLPDLDKLVRAELVRKSLIGEARGKGWEQRPEVQMLMERAKEQALLSAYVQSFVRPPAGYPSEDEVKAAYEGNKKALVAPVQFQIATVFIATPDATDKAQNSAAAKKATDLSAMLQKNPGEFARIAKEESDQKETAARGGEIGWVTENQLAPELRPVITALEKGAISSALKLKNGWYLIKVMDKRPSRQRTFEESRAFLVATMRQRKTQENERLYLESVLQKSVLTVNQIELSKFQDSLKK
ncbi:MAG: peptidylprolyl isomerase [Burkholderiales bacterium]